MPSGVRRIPCRLKNFISGRPGFTMPTRCLRIMAAIPWIFSIGAVLETANVSYSNAVKVSPAFGDRADAWTHGIGRSEPQPLDQATMDADCVRDDGVGGGGIGLYFCSNGITSR